MNWRANPYTDFLSPFWRGRGGARSLRGILRGAGRRARPMMRTARPYKRRWSFCCCPVFFALGLAGFGSIAGLFYVALHLLGWA